MPKIETIPLAEAGHFPPAEAGHFPPYTTDQYPGALPNGTLITKTGTVAGDANPDGAVGTVLGSLGANGTLQGYFVEWRTYPGVSCFVVPERVKRWAA
jgi:hypothetical protein